MAYPKSTSNLSLSGPQFHAWKYVVSIILTLPGKTSSHVLNYKHFAETMTDVTLAEDEVLVSFNVSSLFTIVPIGEAVEVIQA